uniref:Uncharacterized LOC100182600 n=1 Tax=Ciona intestinalis TaxID=7719 RepID=F6QRD6_CIOIN|nr:uncharacterized protein LOC100182600 [Ciona intestinalis]|eukprot:XP_002121809.1 uncharacterized protein LOC100182600 [Ciona intestinalis]
MQHQAILLCSILFAFYAPGQAIECYSCSTSTTTPNTGCMTETLADSNRKNCTTGLNYCTTSTIYAEFLNRTTVTTVRDCALLNVTGITCTNIIGVGQTYTSTCSTDNCNTGTNADTNPTVCPTVSSAGKVAGGYTFIAFSLVAAILQSIQ